MAELVSNVIAHVGQGTSTTLTVTMRGPHLRIEAHDPATRTLPTLIEADADREGGRGMALVAATAVRLGVELLPDRKVTWCELATTESPLPWRRSPRFNRAEGLLDLYQAEEAQGVAAGRTGFGRLTLACAEEAAIDIIADLLHWFHVQGRDADDVLDRAQVYFEAGLGPHPAQAHASP